MSGRSLLEDVSKATGLPSDLAFRELKSLVEKSGVAMEQLSLEELREILADYLQDVLLQAKKELSSESSQK